VSKPLIVVESPTKVRTLKKYLGKEFKVAATVGHIKDLPQRKLGIDIDNGFKPEYRTIPGKEKVIKELKKAASSSAAIYLAPDPDREGEAIAWHTSEVLKKKDRRFQRVLFHELTQKAVLEALETPQALDRNKFDAQQTRRILDRLVGYEISPLLWRKVKSGLSAGRVQSVAVRIICERERAIMAFVPQEYWSITAHLVSDDPQAKFSAKLVKKGKEKIHIPDQTSAEKIVASLEGEPFKVEKVVKRTTKRRPHPPFITSKLQQEAIRKLRFSARKTMQVAQQLYEGIDLGPGEPEGLITYMRTDSTRVSAEAAREALSLIKSRFGPDYAPDKPRFYANRKKAQDAHEAIRPTSVHQSPDKIATYLNADQMALYTLIWKRFVASQMNNALINQNSVSIRSADYLFTASGSSIAFPGFMGLYQTAEQEREAQSDKGRSLLPDLPEGISLKCDQLMPKQHFTQPPPRFSEASLVKELEENGIGRPSTYAAILSTIRGKGYVELVRGYFRPNELGFIVNDLVVNSFPDIFGVDFTAKMEDNLDRIEGAELEAEQVLQRFYDSFKRELDKAAEDMLSMKRTGIATSLRCPECNQHQLHIKVGKNGHFLACNGYPDCTYTRDYTRDEQGKIKPVEVSQGEMVDKHCPVCGKQMMLRNGRYGQFFACSGYPDCKHTESLDAANGNNKTGVNCPKPGCDGELVQRKSKRGKVFYGCSRYPQCDYATWDKPVNRSCPLCGGKILLEKTTKKEGTVHVCPDKKCKYRQAQPDKAES
jgi:DNA topoisomerase-1